MKTAKYFDVHDKNITPEIYTLLFSGAYIELTGNDAYYRIDPFGDEEDEDSGWKPYVLGYHDAEYYDTEKAFKKRVRVAIDHNTCYYDKKRMQEFCKNPCTCAEAVEHFKLWLKEQGVTEKDIIIVKIWW